MLGQVTLVQDRSYTTLYRRFIRFKKSTQCSAIQSVSNSPSGSSTARRSASRSARAFWSTFRRSAVATSPSNCDCGNAGGHDKLLASSFLDDLRVRNVEPQSRNENMDSGGAQDARTLTLHLQSPAPERSIPVVVDAVTCSQMRCGQVKARARRKAKRNPLYKPI